MLNKNKLFALLPILIEVRIKVLNYSKKQLLNDKEFKKIIGDRISIHRLISIEDGYASMIDVVNYINAFLIYLDIDENELDFENMEQIMEICNQKCHEKRNKKLFHSSSTSLLKINSIAHLNKTIGLLDISKIPLIIEYYKICLQKDTNVKRIYYHIIDTIKYSSIDKSFANAKKNTNEYSQSEYEYHRKLTEDLIQLISCDSKIGRYVHEIYLTGLDLSCLDLTCGENNNQSLKNAWLNDTNISHTNFSGFNLENVNFNRVTASVSACFKNSNLENASFRGADLRGVNRKGRLKNSPFIDEMSLEEAGSPFLKAKNINKRNIDPWLKDFIIQNGMSKLFKQS